MNKSYISCNNQITLENKNILYNILSKYNTDEFGPIASDIIDALLNQELKFDYDIHEEPALNKEKIDGILYDLDNIKCALENLK
ncbi:MAG: hypothetical protein M0R17_03325 [Candidatus Omnitrophica bacterium]|jgi:transcription initiation factor IIE alpha subunit|nr:hypothetical protein [Candidatus Omnitrophota bacterium]